MTTAKTDLTAAAKNVAAALSSMLDGAGTMSDLREAGVSAPDRILGVAKLNAEGMLDTDATTVPWTYKLKRTEGS